MATVQRPEERYLEFDEYINFQLDKARNGIKWTDILAAAAGVSTLLIGYLVVFVMADHWLFDGGVPARLRTVSLSVVAFIAIGWIGWKVVWPYVRRVNDLYAAQMLERAEPGLQGSLFGLVDSRRSGRPPIDEVRRVLERRAATTLSNVDVDSTLDRRQLMKTAYVLLAVVLIACVYAVASPKRIGPSLLRAFLPSSNIGVATRTEILEVRPGNVVVLAGEELPVLVMLRGEAPEKVLLYFSTTDRRFVDEPIEMRLTDETSREYRAVLVGDAGRGLSQDLTYRVVANDDAAGPFTVDVDQPPAATVTSVALAYPAYTELDPTERDVPQIEAIAGTNVTLKATANRPLKSAKLVFADDDRFLARGEEVPLRVAKDGKSLTASWKLAIRSDGSSPTFYRIECRDLAGKTNPKPAVYPISIQPDLAPEVTLHDPKSDLERPANAMIPLLVTARDPDFRLRELTLRIEKRGQELPDRTVLWEGTEAEAAVRHDWDLGPLGLTPGDVVSFFVQARDNREPEFNRRNTQKLNITITAPVAKEEIAEQLAQEKQRQEQEFAESQDTTDLDPEQQPPDQQTTEEGEAATSEKTNEAAADSTDENRSESNETDDNSQERSSKNDDQAAPVKNDGSQDDKVLRKLLDNQKKEKQKDVSANDSSDDSQEGSSAAEKPDQDSQRDPQKNGGGSKSSSQNESPPPESNSQNEPSDNSAEANKQDGAGTEKGEQQGSKQGAKASSQEGTTDTTDQENSPPDPKNASSKPQESGGENSKTGDQSGDSVENPGNENGTSGASGTSEDSNETPKGMSNSGSGEPGDDEGPAEEGDATSPTQNKPKGQESADKDAQNAATDGEQTAGDSTSDRANQAADDSPASADPDPGQGRPDQKSEKPDSGEQGKGQPNVDGAPDDAKGESAAGTKPGSEKVSDQSTGKLGGQATEKGRPGEGKSDNAAEPSNTPAKESNPDGSSEPKPSTSKSTTESSKSTSDPAESPSTQGAEDKASGESEKDAASPEGKFGDGKSGDGKSGEGKSGEGKSGEGKSGEGKSGEGKSGEGKSGEGKSGEGKSGEGKSGEGKSGEGKSGEGKSGEGKSGEGKSGEGKSGEGKSGEGKSGEGKSGEGKSGEGKSGEGKSGEGGAATGGGSKPGSTGGQGSSNATSSEASEAGNGDGDGGGAGEGPANSAEAANTNFTKQATDLALKKLENDLQRGDVDPQLLKELGWTEEDMRHFADRLKKNLEGPTGEETPQEAAQRREFEHMLESLSMESGPSSREARRDRVRNVEGVGTKNPQIPSAYRDAYEAFTRSVAGRRSTGSQPK